MLFRLGFRDEWVPLSKNIMQCKVGTSSGQTEDVQLGGGSA